MLDSGDEFANPANLAASSHSRGRNIATQIMQRGVNFMPFASSTARQRLVLIAFLPEISADKASHTSYRHKGTDG